MLFRKTNSNDTKINGQIKYYALESWWLTAFSSQERDHIQDIYHPMGSDPRTKPLTEGSISWSSGSAASLLTSLAGWFNNGRDREIAKTIIEKATDLAIRDGIILDQHFALGEKMVIHYRDRDSIPDALEAAVKAARGQISIASQAVAAFIKEYPGQALPAHAGYRQLRIILEKEGKYDEAIELCEKAKEQGWNDNWDKIISTIKNKQRKANQCK